MLGGFVSPVIKRELQGLAPLLWTCPLRSVRRCGIESEYLLSMLGLPLHKLTSKAVIWLARLICAFLEGIKDDFIELDVELRRLNLSVRLLYLRNGGAAEALD